MTGKAIRFEGQHFSSLKALRDAYPVYAGSHMVEYIRQGHDTIAALELITAERNRIARAYNRKMVKAKCQPFVIQRKAQG